MRTPRSSIQAVLVVGALVITSLLINPNRATAGTPVQGPISTDTSWTADGSPYWVEGDVVVLSPANLTVEPGVEVLFNGLYAIYVEGILYSVGTPASAIDFTSNLSTPSPGDWKGLQVNATGRATIRHTDVTYAVNGVRIDASSSNQVSQSHIAHHLQAGISIVNGSVGDQIEQNSIQNNGDGIYINGASLTVISGNNMSFNDNGMNCCSGCVDSVIEENHMRMNAYHAVRMEGGDNIIRNNTMTENSYAGTRWGSFYCYDGSVYNEEAQSAVFSIGGGNTFLGNTIADTAGIGVALDCGAMEHVEGNIIRGNEKGISVFGSPSHNDPGSEVQAEWNVVTNNGEDGITVTRALLKKVDNGAAWWSISAIVEGEERVYEMLLEDDYDILKIRYRNSETGLIEEIIPDQDEETEDETETETIGPDYYAQYSVGEEKIKTKAGSFKADHIVFEDKNVEEGYHFKYEYWLSDRVPGLSVKYIYANISEQETIRGEVIDIRGGYKTQLDSY